MEKKLSYEEALAQLQELVEVIERPDAQIAGVEKELKKAMELLEFCRKELDGYENDFNRILNNGQL
jgi:exodeoxyribonuclease VII small subunit